MTTCGVSGWVGVPHGYSWDNLYSRHCFWNQTPGGALCSVLYLRWPGVRGPPGGCWDIHIQVPLLNASVLEISLGNEMVPPLHGTASHRGKRLRLPHVLTQQTAVQRVSCIHESLWVASKKRRRPRGHGSSAGKLLWALNGWKKYLRGA